MNPDIISMGGIKMKLLIDGDTIRFSNKEEEMIITFAKEKSLSIHDLLMLSLISLDEEHFAKNYQSQHHKDDKK